MIAVHPRPNTILVIPTPDGDVLISYSKQPPGFEHKAFTACWRDASADEFGGADIVHAGTTDAAVELLRKDFPRGVDL